MIDVVPVTGPLAKEILDLLKEPYRPEGDEIKSFGMTIKGFFDVLCKNPDGSVDWEVHQPNLLTDTGRRLWMYNGIYRGGLFTSGVADTPVAGRCSLNESYGTSQILTTDTVPTVDWGAITKSVSTTFGTPGSNRQIATVGFVTNFISASYLNNVTYGPNWIVCYSRINPVKTQLTTQTLEISYRLTMKVGV
jgi:hypothetical protein